MELDILQQEGMLKEMADKQIKSLLKDLTDSFETLSKKEGVPAKDIQLAIRYDSTIMSAYIYKRIEDLAIRTYELLSPELNELQKLQDVNDIAGIVEFWKKQAENFSFEQNSVKQINAKQFRAVSTLPADRDFQLAVRFKEIPNSNGDCNFYYTILKSWTEKETKQWLDDFKKSALESYLIAKLEPITGEYNVTTWEDVSVIFHIQKGFLKMSIYTNVDGAPVNRKNFVMANEPLKDMNFIYFQILKNWKPIRRANFSKDFLNAETIMKDEREDLIRIYLAGGKIQIPGMQEPITMPGNLDLVSDKHKLGWNEIAFIFFKENEAANPQLGIYHAQMTEEVGGFKFEQKETVDIFSLEVPNLPSHEDEATETKNV